MKNYFNSLSFREKLMQLGRCRFMDLSEFIEGVKFLKGKKKLQLLVVELKVYIKD
jgi:ketol-acid reductoisomerase